MQQKRIYIDKSQLPVTWLPAYPFNCQEDSLLFCRPPSCINEVFNELVPLTSADVPAGAIQKGGGIIGYFGAGAECVDCTLRGTKQAPAFWQ